MGSEMCIRDSLGDLIFCNFEGSTGMLSALARYPVIFSHIGHTAMAAEAPHLHMGDLGRLEEVRNGRFGADTVGYRGSTR